MSWTGTEGAREGATDEIRNRRINDGARRIVDGQKVGTSRRRQARGTTGKGVLGRWEGRRSSRRRRQSLVTGDTRCAGGVPEPTSTVWHKHGTVPRPAPTGGRKTRAPQYVNGFSMIISILGWPSCQGWEGLAHVCREQGPTKRNRNGVGWGRSRGGRDAR